MQSLRPGSVIDKLAATAPFREKQGPGHSISPAVKEVIANVDHSLRQLLADESHICKGPNWSDLLSSSTTVGSRLDRLIAYNDYEYCDCYYRCLGCGFQNGGVTITSC